MQLSVKQFVKLKEYQEQRIKELWCEEQQADAQQIIDLMESVANSAFDAAKSSQGYDTMKHSKHQFTDVLLSIFEKYRMVKPVYDRRSTDTPIESPPQYSAMKAHTYTHIGEL